MKKFLLLLLITFLFSPCLACIVNGVQITSLNVSLYYLQTGLLTSARYNYYDNNYVYLIALNDSNLGLRITNQSLEFSVLSDKGVAVDSINWEGVLRTELSWFVNNSIINLSEDNIDLISLGGCCHTYSLLNDSLEELFPRCLDEGFVIPIIDSSLSWISVLLSIIPVLIISFYFARFKKKYWTAFMIGCAGWFIALFLRQQIFPFIYQIPYYIIILFLSSLLAGVFEEVIRYLLLKHIKSAKKNPLMFGLGWGLFEALLIYAFTIGSYILLNQPVLLSVSLLGAFERNIAILLHVALSFIVFKALKNIKYLYLGIGLHAVVNFLATFLYFIIGLNALLTEFALLGLTLLLFYYSYTINKKLFKRLV